MTFKPGLSKAVKCLLTGRAAFTSVFPLNTATVHSGGGIKVKNSFVPRAAFLICIFSVVSGLTYLKDDIYNISACITNK